MIVHLIITATGLFFFYSAIGLAHTYAGIIPAHAMLGIEKEQTGGGNDQRHDHRGII